MSAVVIVIAGLALAAAVAALACLAVVIAGIHGEERGQSLAGAPRTRRGRLARKVLGFHATATPSLPASRPRVSSRR